MDIDALNKLLSAMNAGKGDAENKAKSIASRLSEQDINDLKRCAAKAKDIKDLFSDPEFRKIIARARNG